MHHCTRRAVLGGAAAAALTAGFGAGPARAQAPGDPAAAFSALLGRYVSEHADGVNRVDYSRWRADTADMSALNAAISAWTRMSPSRMAREEAFAYWANLYNAVTLQVVLARYPVRSIRDIRSEGVLFDPQAFLGPWRTKRVTVEGRRLSLDDIEHGTLRPLARDPRVHYAVNCASIGCPNLQRSAWSAQTLDADLDRAARAYINHPRGVTVLADGSLRVSSIYHWFREDFGGDNAGVIDHLRRYAAPALAPRLSAAPRISGHAYDWSLNDASA